MLWPGAVVPYKIDESFKRSDRETLAVAMREIEAASCVRFKELSAVGRFENFVTIKRECAPGSGDWCFSGGWVDFLGASRSSLTIGNTRLNQRERRSVGLVVHEILHVLGISHTQKRPDRKKYIRVLNNNINKTDTAVHQYKECNHCTTYGVPYDCMSIMHYRDYYFSINNRKTMVPVDKNSDCDLNSNNNKLTQSDKDLINIMYCGKSPTITTTTTTTTRRPKFSGPCCTKIEISAPRWVKQHIGYLFTGTYLLISQEGSTEPRYRFMDGDYFQEIVGEPLQGTMIWWIKAPGINRQSENIMVARQMTGLCLSEEQPQQWYDLPKGRSRMKALNVRMRCLN